jgi:hypothetical protein
MCGKLPMFDLCLHLQLFVNKQKAVAMSAQFLMLAFQTDGHVSLQGSA